MAPIHSLLLGAGAVGAALALASGAPTTFGEWVAMVGLGSVGGGGVVAGAFALKPRRRRRRRATSGSRECVERAARRVDTLAARLEVAAVELRRRSESMRKRQSIAEAVGTVGVVVAALRIGGAAQSVADELATLGVTPARPDGGGRTRLAGQSPSGRVESHRHAADDHEIPPFLRAR
ncbi:hypothetical protein E4T66_18475 [Sinimarinibacterium sp. CAU 1509]|uniref:hypothetical protein n=1 Tax=Sinimarinibacterium sp. CAU 1509 TaxID=2562283 RepID=UPI0010AD4F97|nr:hypothetical protein [Sinimarinibacterium sp. CAU 1509]TJY57393.1 hypothetical protein E4T66_18475 [Sinimarinibacterium sp. CAU 1509]